jgi:FkbM family methyltransferase
MKVFPDRKHLLFEPVTEFADHIRRQYSKIEHTLVLAAVADSEGEVTLQTRSVFPGQAITHSDIVRGPVSGGDTRSVPAVTLDGYLSRNPAKAPFLVKIDVDGAELAVMRGAVETLKQASVIVVETTRHALAQRVAALEGLGFVLFDLADLCYYDRAFSQCDAVMLRRDLIEALFANPKRNFDPKKYTRLTA